MYNPPASSPPAPATERQLTVIADPGPQPRRWGFCAVAVCVLVTFSIAVAGLAMVVHLNDKWDLVEQASEFGSLQLSALALNLDVAGTTYPLALDLNAATGALLTVPDTRTAVVTIVGSVAVGTVLASDRVDYTLSLANSSVVSYYVWIFNADASPLTHVTGSPLGPLSGTAQGTLKLTAPLPSALLYALVVQAPGWQHVHPLSSKK